MDTSTPRICSVEGCDKPHFGKGFCTRHYQSYRYHNFPEHRAKKLQAAKEFNLARPEVHALACERYREKHLKQVRAQSLAYARREKDKLGVYPGARFRPGDPCSVFVKNELVFGTIDSPAYGGGNNWSIMVALPWGESVEFQTTEVKVCLNRKKKGKLLRADQAST